MTRPVAQATSGPSLVSCVMPAYNEREGIRTAVEHVRQAVERLTTGFEIIVVDDGSTDGTGQREVPVGHRPRLTGRSKVGFRQIPRSLWQVYGLNHALRNGNGKRVLPDQT
jgi:glycosyltransferase involved in cell wall biosynthesis